MEETVFITREQERIAMEAMFNFVLRTTTNSNQASPAELAILPGMSKLVFDYWGISS